jgi:general secretion pathway protein I
MTAWRHPPAADGRRGFTLLEVLVAFTIAALLLVVIFRTIAGGLSGGQRAEAYTRATILAESTLDALGAVAPLNDDDHADVEDGKFRIHTAVERYRGSLASAGLGQYLVLYRITATVSWQEGRRPQSVSLTTLRLGPQPAQHP